jgi:hypothetical protein
LREEEAVVFATRHQRQQSHQGACPKPPSPECHVSSRPEPPVHEQGEPTLERAIRQGLESIPAKHAAHPVAHPVARRPPGGSIAARLPAASVYSSSMYRGPVCSLEPPRAGETRVGFRRVFASRAWVGCDDGLDDRPG